MNDFQAKIETSVSIDNQILMPKALPKHRYPVFIYIFFGGILCLSLVIIPRFLIYDLPHHRLMHIQLVQARKAFEASNYPQAIDYYQKVVSEYPHYKEGTLALAKSLFALSAQTGHVAYFQFGMWYLEGEKYSNSEKQDLFTYVPKAYQQEFKNAWRNT